MCYMGTSKIDYELNCKLQNKTFVNTVATLCGIHLQTFITIACFKKKKIFWMMYRCSSVLQ